MILATRPVIAARAEFLTLCSCDGDGRGRRQHPPHEPLQIGVGCVFFWWWVAVYFLFCFFPLRLSPCSLFFPGNVFVNPLIFKTEPENTKSTSSLCLFVCLSLCICNFNSWWLITGLHSNLLIDHTAGNHRILWEMWLLLKDNKQI